jgi:hypothetical protein
MSDGGPVGGPETASEPIFVGGDDAAHRMSSRDRSIANIQRFGKPVAGAGPGNTRALVHGARADLLIAPRAAELRDHLRELVPAGSPSDEPALTLLSWQLARIEQANVYLAEQGLLDGKGIPRPVLKVLSTWENSAARLCDQLGMTPTARGRLGLDLARSRAIGRGGSADEFDLARLSDEDLDQLEALYAKAVATPLG